MKITALGESTDFATLNIEKLFSKLKSHEQPRKGRPNHDASLTSKTEPNRPCIWACICILHAHMHSGAKIPSPIEHVFQNPFCKV
jgi:hypothetical protein